jgi:type VI protein secretion system component VasK
MNKEQDTDDFFPKSMVDKYLEDQPKDEVKEDWVEDSAGSLWRKIHQQEKRIKQEMKEMRGTEYANGWSDAVDKLLDLIK